MWTLFDRLGGLIPRPARRRDELARRSARVLGRRVGLEGLERRSLCSVGGHHTPVQVAHHHAEVRVIVPQASGAAERGDAALVPIDAAKKQRSFTIAQENKFLPGKWRVLYDASSVFGPGAEGAQEITFTGPKGAKTFISTTGVEVPGFFGPAYYQFSSWGTYQFLNKKLLRLTITGGSPTEYLNDGIIVMGGQFMPIQFQSNNQFAVQGQEYNRIPLNSTIFNA
jgi:hypothetical protein